MGAYLFVGIFMIYSPVGSISSLLGRIQLVWSLNPIANIILHVAQFENICCAPFKCCVCSIYVAHLLHLGCTVRLGLHEIHTMVRTFPCGLENSHAFKWISDNFPRMLTCVIPGKLSEIHLHAWLFSNPWGKVLKNIKSRGQIGPYVPILGAEQF